MADEELSDSEKQEIKDLLGYGSQLPEGKQNVHTFLFNVATAEDTTKLGFLKDEEVGSLGNPVRSFKHLASFSGRIMGKPDLEKYFLGNSEIITSTSLSRQGFLVDRAVIQKRELKDTTSKPRKENPGWFKGKDKNKETEGGEQ